MAKDYNHQCNCFQFFDFLLEYEQQGKDWQERLLKCLSEVFAASSIVVSSVDIAILFTSMVKSAVQVDSVEHVGLFKSFFPLKDVEVSVKARL